MIVLFTDFGLNGPYLGQMKAVLCRDAPGVPVIDLFANAPAHDPKRAAYLLAAYAPAFPADTVFLAVVDPGVGGERAAGVLDADGRWYVGPDNGLFALVQRRAETSPRWWEIRWRPERLSATFHGRDVFAPIAARIARGETPGGNADFDEVAADRINRPDWPDELPEIIYIDDFGNAMTGLRASAVSPECGISVSGMVVRQARNFSESPEGEVFWYENSNGLVELSVNQGRADEILGLEIGSNVALRKM